jgi:flagellar protein FlaJ
MELELESIFGKSKKTQTITLSCILVGWFLFIYNYLYFRDIPKLYSLLNIVSIFFFVVPPFLVRYYEYRKEKEMESRFPDFLGDVAEAIYSGMTLPQAIKHVMKNDYGRLSKYVRQIGVQVDWGIPFEKVFKNFAEKTGSKLIKRAVSTIIETHRSGGKIADTLVAVTKSMIEIDKLQKERTSHVHSQILTGYIVYFIFLGIMIALLRFLLPGMIVPEGGSLAAKGSEMAKIYKDMFQWLVLIEGIFSGLSIGKMSEGSIIAGVKHSIILCSVGYTVFVLFG